MQPGKLAKKMEVQEVQERQALEAQRLTVPPIVIETSGVFGSKAAHASDRISVGSQARLL